MFVNWFGGDGLCMQQQDAYSYTFVHIHILLETYNSYKIISDLASCVGAKFPTFVLVVSQKLWITDCFNCIRYTDSLI